MGAYINPPNEEKEDFLIREGEYCANIPEWKDIPKGKMLVVLINNGPFTAAGIAFNKNEYEEFKLPDPRPKRYYVVDIDKLMGVSDLGFYYNKA